MVQGKLTVGQNVTEVEAHSIMPLADTNYVTSNGSVTLKYWEELA